MEVLLDTTKMSCYSISGSEFKIGKGQSERSVKYWIGTVSVERKIEEENRRKTDGKGGWLRRRRIIRKEEEIKVRKDKAIHYTKERDINKSN